MQDFASAAMIRVIQAGVLRLGLPPARASSCKQAHVPLQDKRALVGHVLRTGGWAAVLQVGQGVHDIEDDPLIHLLVQTGQPWRVLSAWLRLERYLHSRHRIAQTRVNDCSALLHHAGRTVGASPLVAESWLVLGVLAALLERSGCRGLDASLQDASPLLRSGRVTASDGQLNEWAQAGNAQTWHVQWRVAQLQATAAALNHTATANQQDQLKNAIQRWVYKTNNWQPDVSDIAAALNLSPRSLQRKLGEQGTRFVDVLGQARVQRASKMLTQSANPLAEIGFATGYSDQAHFCREFKRRTGLSPKAFRDTSLLASQSAVD